MLFLFPLSVWAQETEVVFKGIVTNTEGIGIANVLCKALSATDSLLAYGITQSNGQFHLQYKKNVNKLTFSKMGYATQIISVQKDKYQYTVQLEKKPYELDEVVVKEAPITRKKDTLDYYVESFRQKEDYSIEDVLKRMPGIEVTTSGQILYQGSSINKLNIEGLDLMGDQYNQATQNMPAEAVSTIQVMENNQPIRALEGKIHSNHATLNIRLKKNYKMRPFGDAEVGAGGTPAICKEESSIIYWSLKQQRCLIAQLARWHVELYGHLCTRAIACSFPLFYYNPPSTHFTYLLLEQPFLFCRTELYARFLSLFHFTYQSALQPRRRKP